MHYRDVDSIDRELALLSAVRQSIERLGGDPGTDLIDDLLDERLSIWGWELFARNGSGRVV